MSPRSLFLLGLLIQALVGPVMTLVSRHVEWGFNPWALVGGIGVGASVVCLGAAVRGRGQRALFIPGTLSALLSGLGWGSWLLVGLSSSPDDPVINITGLLVLPGLLLGFIALVLVHWVAWQTRRGFGPDVRGTAALWFGLAHLAFIAVETALTFTGVDSLYLLMFLLQFLLAAWQVARAHLVAPARPSRTLALVGGYLVMASTVAFLLGPFFLFQYTGIGITLAAGVLEWRENRDGRPAPEGGTAYS